MIFQCFRIMPTVDVTPTSKWSSKHPDHKILSRTSLTLRIVISFFPEVKVQNPIEPFKLRSWYWSKDQLNKILLRKITFPVFHLIWGLSKGEVTLELEPDRPNVVVELVAGFWLLCFPWQILYMEVDSDMHRKHHPGWCAKQKQDNVVVTKKVSWL